MIDLKKYTPEIRTLKDMGDVLYDKEWAKRANPDLGLYYMYRGLKKNQGMRYDITVIKALMLGEEFNKTKGHKHKQADEIYIVLKGEAIFLIQIMENNELKQIYAIKGKRGDVCYIPPQSAHFTINPSKENDLYLANWVADNSEFDYDIIQDKRGAAYFYTNSGWTKNNNYDIVPKLKFKTPLKEFPKKYIFLEKESPLVDF